MKHFGKMIVGACTVLTLTCTPAQLLAQSLSPSTQWEWNKGTIVIKSPERPAGQESVIGLTVPKMNVVRVGFVGLGHHVDDIILHSWKNNLCFWISKTCIVF